MSFMCPICNGKLVHIVEKSHLLLVCNNCRWQTSAIQYIDRHSAIEALAKEYNLKHLPNSDFNFKPLSVEYVSNNDLINTIIAARTSHNSIDRMDTYYDDYMEIKLGKKDERLLNMIVDLDHTSVLEHFVLQYEIEIPRFLLQEFARHRIGVSMTVKSTRYTLKEMFETDDLSQFLFRDENNIVNLISLMTLNKIRNEFKDKYEKKLVKIDTIKKPIPETYMTRLFVTINARALRHMFKLRSHKSAHPDFRKLMKLIYNATPKVYRDIILHNLDIEEN